MREFFLVSLPIQSYTMKGMGDSYDYNPSLGLLSLGTYLDLHGYKCRIYDMIFDKIKVSKLLNDIKLKQPIMVCISVYTENVEFAARLSRKIKEISQDIKICWGGPHVTLDEINESSDYLDFAIHNEGESTLLELVEAVISDEEIISFDNIMGLSYYRDNVIYKTRKRGFIEDLDLMPLLKRELTNINKYGNNIFVSSSRGCPANCIYCAATAMAGAKYRMRNIKNVFMEILLLKHTISKAFFVNFVDDTFTASPKRVRQFNKLMKSSETKVGWHCESRVDVMSRELIKDMKDAGCFSLQYGIESGSQDVLDAIKKKIDLKHALDIMDITTDEGLFFTASFMLGHYCDTKKTMMETVNLIKDIESKYSVDVGLSYNTPFPGTWQYTNREKIGLRIINPNTRNWNLFQPIVETDNFTIEDQLKMYKIASPYLNTLTKTSSIRRDR